MLKCFPEQKPKFLVGFYNLQKSSLKAGFMLQTEHAASAIADFLVFAGSCLQLIWHAPAFREFKGGGSVWSHYQVSLFPAFLMCKALCSHGERDHQLSADLTEKSLLLCSFALLIICVDRNE